MARITEELVNSTCEQIRLEGHSVTVKKVMDRIGGNTNDVAPMVKKWKMANSEEANTSDFQSEQSESQPEEKIILPELVEAFDNMRQLLETVVDKQLWKERRHAANVQRGLFDDKEQAISSLSKTHADVISSLSKAHADNLADVERENTDLLDDRSELQNAVKVINCEKDKLVEQLDAMTNERNSAREDNASLNVRYATLVKQIEELNTEIAAQENTAKTLTEIVRQLQQAETRTITERDNAIIEVSRLRPYESNAAAQRQRGDDLDKQIERLRSDKSDLQNANHKISQDFANSKLAHQQTLDDISAKHEQLESVNQLLKNARDDLEKLRQISATERNNSERASDKAQAELTAARKENTVQNAEITRLIATVEKLENAASDANAAHLREIETLRSEHKQVFDAFKQAISEIKSAQPVHDVTSIRRP
jgi:DNA repair exonuclease SbcCD ATPase subunit